MTKVRSYPMTHVPKSVLLSQRGANPCLGFWVFACLGILIFLTGCGSGEMPLGRVSGTVTLDGQPVSGGIIHFMPQSGPAATGVIDASGRYNLTTYSEGDGAVIGSHTIYFAPNSDDSHMEGYSEADYAANKPPPEAPQAKFLPKRYLTPSSSGLSREVAVGSNDFPLQLTTESQP